MVSYADFMTLMFAVFLVLYSFAMSKQSEAQSMVKGLVQSFNEMGLISSTPGVIAIPGPIAQMAADASLASAQASQNKVNAPVQGGGGVMDFGVVLNNEGSTEGDGEGQGDLTQTEALDPNSGAVSTEIKATANEEQTGLEADTDNMSGSEGVSTEELDGEGENGTPFDSIKESLTRTLEEMNELQDVEISADENWLTINIGSKVLFAEQSASILNASRPIIKAIARAISNINNYVRVRGYTDNTYIKDIVYKNNWELSSARANAVLDLLISYGVDPARLASEGYGQYSPLFSNATEAGRAKNRRVVIAISRKAMKSEKLKILDDTQPETDLVPRENNSERKTPRAGEWDLNIDHDEDGAIEFSFDN